MLIHFYSIRRSLEDQASFQRSTRRICGELTVSAGDTQKLKSLQDNGYIVSASKSDGGSLDFGLDDLELGARIRITLQPGSLSYFEDLDDLLSYTPSEPELYYVHSLGVEVSKNNESNPEIELYREMEIAKDFLRNTADLNEGYKVTFFAPEKIEIPLRCKASDLRRIPEIFKLRNELHVDERERDQRIVIFKGSLRNHLRMHATEVRFGIFLTNLSTIYDGYRRDFELWLGNTFADIKKNFEDKRLKFVADLNAVLASVQASLLALPLAAIIVGDKFDVNNPLKNFLLALAVFGASFVAKRVLDNQSNTLDAIKASIEAIKTDYEKQQPAGSAEYKSRLTAVDKQYDKVVSLLRSFRNAITVISASVAIAWLLSFGAYLRPYLSPSKNDKQQKTPQQSDSIAKKPPEPPGPQVKIPEAKAVDIDKSETPLSD